MASLDVARGRARRQAHLPKRVSAADKQQRKWHRVTLELVGTFFVLTSIAIGLLTLRFALVLMHGVLH